MEQQLGDALQVTALKALAVRAGADKVRADKGRDVALASLSWQRAAHAGTPPPYEGYSTPRACCAHQGTTGRALVLGSSHPCAGVYGHCASE